MTKIQKFDQDVCRLVAAQFEKALQAVAQDLGVSVRYRGGQFSDAVYTMKIEVGVMAGDGDPWTRERENLFRLGELIGIPKHKIGAVFTLSGVEYRLTGMRTRAGRFPLIAERTDDGRRFKFGIERVQEAMGLPKNHFLGRR